MKCKVELSEKFRKELELLKAKPSPVEDLLVRQVRTAMASLPPLPIGWRYEIHTEVVQKDGNYFQNISFTPRQKFIVQGD